MNSRLSFALSLALLTVSPGVALANGAVSEFPAGGVVFKHEPHISIAREDLEIGWDRIHVHYVLQSSASSPLKRTMGFPLAKVPQDDSPDGIGGNDLGHNYLDFTAKVNGRPVASKLHEYGWLDDTNVTTKLKKMGVPIYAPTPDDFAKLAKLPKATRKKLIADGLVDADTESDWLIPQWYYQAVYEWKQSFAPGRTELDVTYAPLGGATNDYGWYYPGGEGAKNFCIGDDVKKKLAAYPSPLAGPEPVTVGYILQTARNWNGPIGEFHLKIVDKDSLSAFCPPEGLKRAADGKSWEAKDFVPRSDLEVLFFYIEPKE